MKHYTFTICLILLVGRQVLQGQNSPFVLGHIDTLHSNILGETRTLNIYLPPDYSPDSAHTYPVIYLLDGAADEDFIHIAGLVQFASFPWVEHLAPSILVGIANTDRKRDFTYTAASNFTFPKELATFQSTHKTSGGSANFMAFMEKELQPYIEKHYKVKKEEKTLIGQSLAGLMAAEFVLKKPQLFNTYIIMSPSLWWDNESLLNTSPATPLTHTRVYLAVGKEGKLMEGPARKLASLLKKSGGFEEVIFEYWPKEDHGTILHPAVARAFRLLKK